MGNRFVDVVITRQTAAVSQKGFGLPLILSTEKDQAYTEYTDVSVIGTDFGTDSKTYKLASSILGQSPRPEKVAVYGISTYVDGDPVTELSAALNTLILTNNDFYYLTCVEQEDAEITELANWIKTQDKIYVASTSNKTLGTTLANERVFLMVHDDPTTYPGEALMGQLAPQEIGSYTWTFKTVNGIVPATYNETDISAIHDANGCTYIKEGGVNISSHGVMTSGDYADIIQSSDYIKARMTENVFGLMVRNPKIPFTNAGIAMVVAEVENTLKDAYNNGIVADEDGKPLFAVTAPTRSEISANDRAARTLPDINWTVTIAGAVEDVKINGVLQV